VRINTVMVDFGFLINLPAMVTRWADGSVGRAEQQGLPCPISFR